MNQREELEKALKAQFDDVSSGGDGQRKKESVETLQILYNLKMAQDKADQEAEFKESEMVLKEEEAALEREKFEEDQKQKEREDKIKRVEAKLRGLETGAKISTGIIGMALYQKNFKALVANETSVHVIAQRPFMFLKGIERLAINGVRAIL